MGSRSSRPPPEAEPLEGERPRSSELARGVRFVVERWRRSLCFQAAAASAPAFATALPLLVETPLSHDHPTHIFKAWHFWTEMLARGRLRGWSHFWGFGFPSDELVPCGGELWVALFRVVSLGQLSWLRTYTLAFAAFLVLKALAAFFFTRRYFGAGAALIAAWLTSLDVGAFSEGGWVWNTEWGVWPVSLSMSLCLLAFVALDGVLRSGRALHAGCAGVGIAGALLAHQVALLVLAVTLPLLLVERCLGPRPAPLARLGAAAGAALFGLALAAFTILPFLARSRYTMDLGASDESLGQVALQLLELRTFARLSPVVHGLALYGGWVALRARRRGALFIAGSAAAFVLLSSDLLTSVLHLERVMPSLIKIEAARMLLVAKLFWFPLAGYATVDLFRRAGRIGAGAAPSRRRWGAGLRAALVAALVLPPLPRLYETWIARGIVGETDIPHWADLEQVFAWSRALREREPGWYRVAYALHPDDHSSSLAPVYDGMPSYKIGDTASQIFDGLPMTDGPEMLRALSVRYVVSPAPRPGQELTLERRFGALGVYRVERFAPEPFELRGPGRVQVLEIAPERLRARLSGTNRGGRLRIHVAAYPRWRATLDGVPVPLTTVTVHGAEDPVLMELPAADGELVVEYVAEAVDHVGATLSLAALPAFLALASLTRRRGGRVLEALERRRGWLGWAVGVAVAGAALILVLRARDASRILPKQSIFYRDLSMWFDGQPCQRDTGLGFTCGAERVEAGLVHARGDHLCMAAPMTGELSVRLRARLQSFVMGRYDAKGTPGTIGVAIDGRPVGHVSTRPAYMRQQTIQLDTRSRAGDEADIELRVAGGALRCFDFWLR